MEFSNFAAANARCGFLFPTLQLIAQKVFMSHRRAVRSDGAFSFWYFASLGTPIWDFFPRFCGKSHFVLTFSSVSSSERLPFVVPPYYYFHAKDYPFPGTSSL